MKKIAKILYIKEERDVFRMIFLSDDISSQFNFSASLLDFPYWFFSPIDFEHFMSPTLFYVLNDWHNKKSMGKIKLEIPAMKVFQYFKWYMFAR